ncbi:MAG: cytochrome ubiquinol oxidase subunit I, partial [Thermomicrobiales bacterium]
LYGDRAGDEIDYLPLMEVTYWGFRMMIGFGVLAATASGLALWLTRKGTVPASKWLMRLALLSIAAPFAANIAGWVFTEMGRQPFVVAPNPTGVDGVFMFVAAAVSPTLSSGELIVSLVTLTSVYAVLLVVEVKLLIKYVRGGVASALPELAVDHSVPSEPENEDDVLGFAY